MSRNLIDHYREFYRDNEDVFVASNGPERPSPLYTKYDIADHCGRGWTDMYQISHGLMIGRGQFSLRSPWQCEYCAQSDNLSLYILLSGKVRISDARGAVPREFSSGAMLIHEHSVRESCALHYEQIPDCQFEGVSIEIPATMADDLRMGARIHKCAGSPLDMDSLCPQHPCYLYGLQVARMILNQSTDSVIGRLQMEAAALDLIVRVCAGENQKHASSRQHLPARQRIAVDEVKQILESEFNHAHTITSLSRRVQLNECYLKSAFRKATGYTIAEYLRKARMAHARHLIEKHQASVLYAALSVGYANPSHFTAAFRAVYGVLPSSLKRNLF